MVLNLKSADGMRSTDVGIEFGVLENGRSVRKSFDERTFNYGNKSPFSSGLFLGNWDEAMAFVCFIGEWLNLKEVRLRYGI